MPHDLSLLVDTANGAVLDGRLDNVAFKHMQLYALFEELQQDGTAHLEQYPSDQRTTELEHTLRLISQTVDHLPRNITAHFKTRQVLRDIKGGAGRRERASGVLLIVADEAHPFASWAVPLSQAIFDGNGAIILTLPNCLVPPSLAKRLDSSAYSFQAVTSQSVGKSLSSAGKIAGVIGPTAILPEQFTTHSGDSSIRYLSIRSGPVPLIIDQSILPSGKPLTQKQEKQLLVPASIKLVAAHLAAALAHQDSHQPSLGAPAYILAHENLVNPLLRALEAALPASVNIQHSPLAENKDDIRTFLNGLQSGRPDFLPVYSVRSIDMAMDFMQADIALPSVAYVYAQHAFGAYAFNHLKDIAAVHLNKIPAATLALGPYAEASTFSFTSFSVVSFSRQLSHASSAAPSLSVVKSLKARKLVQKPGHRIDFFGGSFMFSAGLTASALLGLTSYGLYRGVLAILYFSRSNFK